MDNLVSAYYWLGSTAAQVYAALAALSAVFAIFRLQYLYSKDNLTFLDKQRRSTGTLCNWWSPEGILRESEHRIEWQWREWERALRRKSLLSRLQKDRHAEKVMRDQYKEFLGNRNRVWRLYMLERIIREAVKLTIWICGFGAVLGVAMMLASWEYVLQQCGNWTLYALGIVHCILIGLTFYFGWKTALHEPSNKRYQHLPTWGDLHLIEGKQENHS